MAIRVFGVDPEGKSEEQIANEGIDRLVEFWTSIGAPSSLKDYDIDNSRFSDIVDKTLVYGEFGNFNKLNGEDVEKILQASL